MIPEGVKTAKSDSMVTQNYADHHLKIGIESLKKLRDANRSVKHLRF